MLKRFLYLVSLTILISCSDQNITEIDNSNLGSVQFSLNKQSTPQEVVKLVLRLTREGFSTIEKSMIIESVNSTNLIISNLYSGNWNLVVNAYDEHEMIIYTGEMNINVEPNSIIPVNLQLNSTTGSILLSVSWGKNLEDEIIAFYPFTGNVNDYSGKGLNGTLYGAEFVNDRFGNPNNALYFDGNNDFIQIYDNDKLTPLNQQLTIAAWVKVFGSKDKYILYKGSTLYNREYAFGIRTDSRASLHINNQGSWNEGQIGVPSSTSLLDDRWYFIVGTWNGKELNMYINGVLENTIITNHVIGNYTSDLFIGSYGGDISKYAFNGIIDDLLLLNRTLTSSEIEKLYNITKN
ncbi:MAG: LamG domain-containing protein [Ignavibacteriae bacterium]|nr:LamG domain-containing protein [Ignavibacteriota bacterium]